MKTKILTVIIALAFAGFACDSTSSNDEDDLVDELVGTWVSEGAGNVAIGLAAFFQTAKIDAVFEENGSYNVVSIDSSGAAVTFTGTFQTGDETPSGIRTIRLQQNEPVSVVSEGIFQIDGNDMTYEVIQTEPNIGAEAPTVEGGFGSTIVNGEATGILWIQRFERN